MTYFRRITIAGCMALLVAAPAAQAEGGFVAIMGGVTDSRDMDSSGNTFKVLFGPRVTDRLSFEMGLMDMGKSSYKDPAVDFSPTLTDDDPAVFSGNPAAFIRPIHGSVSNTNGLLDDPDNPGQPRASTAVYTGFASIHPQSVLFTLSYRFPLRNELDFFLKSGANVWFADYDVVEVTASSDGVNNTVSRRITKTRQTSAVTPITGGGFMWQPIPDVSIRAEIETTALESKEFKRSRFQLLTLGVQYGF